MKNQTCIISFIVGIFVASMASATAQKPENKMMEDTKSKTEIPLIKRELFFDNPVIAGGQLSPDGKWMSFIKPYHDVLNIWVKKVDEPFEKAKPITADSIRPIRGYFWTDDSKFVLYVQDKGGNENFQIYAVNPLDPAIEKGVIPECRNLINKENVRALIYFVSKKEPNIMFVGINDRDAAWHDLYKVNISTGTQELLRENHDRITGWSFDWDENLRLASRSNPDGTSDILRVDQDSLVKIYHADALETSYDDGFTPDNTQFYLITNKGDENNFTSLFLFDPKTQKQTLIEKDPEGKVDFGGISFSDVTHKPILTYYTDAKTRKYWKDKTYEKDYKFLQSSFPGKEIGFASSNKAENKFLVSVYSDTDPSSVYLFDRNTKKIIFQYKPRPNLPTEYLSEMKPITYKSSDGLEIPAYLTIPKGKDAKNLPLLVIPHGGPWARDDWGYNSYAQFFSNRGYAVLQMNFRGSTGYGKAFLNGGNKQWGDLMQDDITWGVKHLVKEGIVDSNRVGILGGSYGGYATLAAITFTPDVYKAAVAIVAPSNLITLLNSIPPYWEAGRKIFHLRMGDPTNEEGLKQLERQSPLNHVDKIKTPLMVVQGANDPRVKKAEADQIVYAMHKKNIPVTYILAPDEGHGFARPVNQMAYLAASEKFLAAHLGGRYQQDMEPDVAKRLEEISVDVSTVAMPQPVTSEE